MLRSFIVCLLTFPGLAHAQLNWERDGVRVQTVIYACQGALEDLSVAYFTAADNTSFAATQIGGVVYAMVQDVAASGVRFVDVNEATGYRLHGKGEALMLLKLEPDHTAEEQLLAECSALPG
jgi:membrane-bound inhibitor of C-type lysozyme